MDVEMHRAMWDWLIGEIVKLSSKIMGFDTTQEDRIIELSLSMKIKNLVSE